MGIEKKAPMTTELVVLNEFELSIIEDMATNAKGSFMKQYGKRFLKGIMLRDKVIHAADETHPKFQAFQEIVNKVCEIGNRLMNEKLFVYTVELSDQRLFEKGIWHTDTSERESWLNLMVPLDDVTPQNGGTLLYEHSSSHGHTPLYGLRGHVYAFKGCVKHCVEGNRMRKPRKILIIVARPHAYLETPNMNVETYRRIMTMRTRGPSKKPKRVYAEHGMRTRSHESL